MIRNVLKEKHQLKAAQLFLAKHLEDQIIKLELDKIATWDGHPVSANRSYFYREGIRINMDADSVKGIEMTTDPKYLTMSKVKLLK